jgi:peptide/nickel transport system substrate-binding protein/oligopeptide transport system substrate-binding protein
VYRKPLRAEPLTLDPAFATDIHAAAVVQQVFDGLVQFDADLNVVPSLAQSWTALHDGLLWTFTLRRDVKFHNGRAVTAQDCVYSFTRLLASKTQSPNAWLFERVRGAKAFRAGEVDQVAGLQALDDYTLQITLSEPYAPFISMLGIAPAKVVPLEEVERSDMPFSRRPIGTGPFRFVTWSAGEKIVLQANKEYFAGRPFLDALHYRIFPSYNVEESLAAFKQGLLEDTTVVAQERQRLIKDTRYHFVRKPILATLFLLINTREAPLNNVKVRQAINYAINRDSISETIRQGRLVRARGILPQGMPGYNPELSAYAYDPQRARDLLAEAGYPGGKGLPPLELWSGSIAPEAQREQEAIKRDLQQVGITVELHTAQSWQHYQTQLLGQRPRAMYRYAWYADFPDPDNFFAVLFQTQGTSNFSNYSNPEVDRLLQRAQRNNVYLERLQLYRRIEELIMSDAPSVNLLYVTFEQLFQPYVQGLALNALGEPYIPMKTIWLDNKHQDISRAPAD